MAWEPAAAVLRLLPCDARGDGTVVVADGGSVIWWTFAGLRANLTLAHLLASAAGYEPQVDNLAVYLPTSAGVTAVLEPIEDVRRHAEWWNQVPVSDDALTGLELSVCLPRPVATSMLRVRIADPEAVAQVLWGVPPFVSVPTDRPQSGGPRAVIPRRIQ